jgi:Outer membrane protein beta-barrel domain
MKKLLPLLLCVSSITLWAQSGELWFSAGTNRLSNSGIGSTSATGGANDWKLDNGFRFGFRFTTNTGGHFGHEFGYDYNRTHLLVTGIDQGGMAIHQGVYNFLAYATPEGSRFRPFATGGGHFANFVLPGSSLSSGGGSTRFGFNYGGGVKIILNSFYGLRFDVRQLETAKPTFGGGLLNATGLLHQTAFTAGFGIHF